MESWFFLCKFYALSICCFFTLLSLSLPKSARHSLGDRPGTVLHLHILVFCTALRWWTIHSHLSRFMANHHSTFSPSAFGITKTSPILSQQCGMNILFHIHSLMSFQTSTTDIISFMDHRRWYFDFMMVSFLRKQWTGAFRLKKKYIKLYDLCHIHVSFLTSFMVLLCPLWSKAPGTCTISFV